MTPSRLARVERAEVAIRALLDDHGLRVENLRVRDLGQLARVELDAALVGAIRLDDTLHAWLLDVVRSAGFDAAELDPRGFRSGSMNALLSEPERYR